MGYIAPVHSVRVRVVRAVVLITLLFGCGATTAPLPPWEVNGKEVIYETRYLPRSHAASEWRLGRPLLYIGSRLADLSRAQAWWVLAHEVCHLGGSDSELSADCCATRWMRQAGWLGIASLVAIVSMVQDWPVSEVHPDGTVRASEILRCSE